MAEDKGRNKEDDNADDRDDDVDDTDDDGDDDSPPSDWKARLKQANDDAKKWRFRATGKDANWKPKSTGDDDTKKPPAKDDQPSADEIRAAARAELEAEYATKAEENSLRGAVGLALTTAGLALSDEEMKNPTSARKAVNRVVNMINLSALTLDPASGDVEGLDDEIADLRKSYPGMFRSGKPVNTTKGGDGANRKNGGEKASGDKDLDNLVKAWFGN
jgi:hypothetical protein